MDFPRLENTLVLGIGHKARHGKDTAGAYLCKMWGATRFSFANALYTYCRVEHGMTVKDAPLLQRVGVHMRETRDPQIWIKALYYQILDMKPKFVVVTDMRFPNEAAFVKQIGGYTVKVSRLNEDGTPFVADDRDPNHPSETALDDYAFDYQITARTGDRLTINERISEIAADAAVRSGGGYMHNPGEAFSAH